MVYDEFISKDRNKYLGTKENTDAEWDAYVADPTNTAVKQAFFLTLTTSVAEPMAELMMLRETVDDLVDAAQANYQFLVAVFKKYETLNPKGDIYDRFTHTPKWLYRCQIHTRTSHTAKYNSTYY